MHQISLIGVLVDLIWVRRGKNIISLLPFDLYSFYFIEVEVNYALRAFALELTPSQETIRYY